MRYVVRYFRDKPEEAAGVSIPTLFLIIKQQAVPSGERVWRMVCKHAARHGWVARGEGEAVQMLDGEASAPRDLLSAKTADGNQAVVCMKLRD